MDWTGCELVEVIPGKVSRAPIVVGTRIPADIVIDFYDHGSSHATILRNYPGLSLETIEGLMASPNHKGCEPPLESFDRRGFSA